jgi:hypothetical protein
LEIKELWCYSNCKIVIKLITNPISAWHHYAAIIHNIKDLLVRDWGVKVVHTLVCTDYLIKFGFHNLEPFAPIAISLTGMSLLLLADVVGPYFLDSFLLFFLCFTS